MAGSIPVHLRYSSPPAMNSGAGGAVLRRKARSEPDGSRLALRLAGGRHRPGGKATRATRHAILVFVLLVVGLPGVAGAQARLISVTPEDGASLSNLEEVVFEFDSLLLPNGAEVRVIRRDGTEIPVASVEVDRSTLTATLTGQLTSGNYEVSYSVSSADGSVNEGSIRVSVDSPEQALSGGLLAVLGGAVMMFGLMFFVLWRDKRRRPSLRG